MSSAGVARTAGRWRGLRATAGFAVLHLGATVLAVGGGYAMAMDRFDSGAPMGALEPAVNGAARILSFPMARGAEDLLPGGLALGGPLWQPLLYGVNSLLWGIILSMGYRWTRERSARGRVKRPGRSQP